MTLVSENKYQRQKINNTSKEETFSIFPPVYTREIFFSFSRKVILVKIFKI